MKELKPHIGIFGRRNNGKSSLINFITGQDIAIVDETAGTTTDPVKKSIEIPGIGPSIIIDTAGIDDEGNLGKKRVERSVDVIRSIDIALLVIVQNQFGEFEKQLANEFYKWGVPYIIIHNKSDVEPLKLSFDVPSIDISAIHYTDSDRKDLIDSIKKNIPETAYKKKSLLGDLVSHGDIVLLITPIDIEAPEGRMILPQVQTIRDILDNDCVAIVLKEREVDAFLRKTGVKPKLAITDSQIFLKADAMIPKDVPLTGFSVLLARHKGDFEAYLHGTPKISELKDGDRVLLLESCTHHVSCDDIGRVKIPRWMSNFTGKKLIFDVIAGLNKIERPLTDYALIIQCGGCVVTRKQLTNRLKPGKVLNIPITNYGMAIAYMQGIYERAVAPFVGNVKVEGDYL